MPLLMVCLEVRSQHCSIFTIFIHASEQKSDFFQIAGIGQAGRKVPKHRWYIHFIFKRFLGPSELHSH